MIAPSTSRSTVLTAIALLVGSLPLLAQSGSGVFILRGEKDTLALEQFRWEGEVLHADITFKAAQARIGFDVTVAADKSVSVLNNRFWAWGDSAGAPPRQSAKIVFRGDSAIAEIGTAGSPVVTQRLGSKPGAIPYLNPSMALLEVLVARARALGGLPVTVPMFAVAGGQVFDGVVSQSTGDTLSIRLSGAEIRLAVTADGKIHGGRIPAQGLTVDRVDALPSAAFAPEKADYSAPANAPYRAIAVTVPTPMGHTLAGTLTLPAAASAAHPVGAIVTITGSGPEDRDEYISIVKDYRPFRILADSLGRRGIAVLRMDDRGTGGSKGSYSGATSADFADDIRAGLAYLRTRPEVARDRLGLLGHSEGGIIAPMVAATDPTLAGMVLFAGPSRPGRGILGYQLSNQFTHDTSRSAASRDSMLARVPAMVDSLGRSDPWLGFFLDYDPATTARKVKVPVLILQGGTDQQVTPDQAPELAVAFRAAGNRDVTLRVLPNLNHLFIYDPSGFPGWYSTLPKAVLDRGAVGLAVDWLVRRLAKR